MMTKEIRKQRNLKKPRLAKVICRANDREDARARLERALDEMYVLGIDTNLDMHRKLINDPNFINGTFNINYLENLNKEK